MDEETLFNVTEKLIVYLKTMGYEAFGKSIVMAFHGDNAFKTWLTEVVEELSLSFSTRDIVEVLSFYAEPYLIGWEE